MRILVLEPYYGGSHQAFLDAWIERSRHDWTLLTLPPYKWKWRMRHSAVTFAEQTHEMGSDAENFDLIFCSDMLNLAEFMGLCHPALRNTKKIVYFHENQLTYPLQPGVNRDFQPVFTNMTTALAADEVWFNSAYNRDAFIDKLPVILKRMPDFRPLSGVDKIKTKSKIRYPGIANFAPRTSRREGPLRLLWAARWEHDKNPEDFFAALEILESHGREFRISVIGEQFRGSPAIFEEAKKRFENRIDQWGFLPSRKDYEMALCDCDVFVSTAIHEFFGISAVEAGAAGALPLLPKRLAYPEVFSDAGNIIEECFFDGSPADLAVKLEKLMDDFGSKVEFPVQLMSRIQRRSKSFDWSKLAQDYDSSLSSLGE